LSKYVGNKNIPGVIEFLANRVPKSKRYFSLFMGAAGLENSVYTAAATFVCSERNTDLWKFKGNNQVLFERYQDLLEANVFESSYDFIFADPPYKFSTRRSQRKYYKFEFETSDHIEFLKHMTSLDCKIMITHPKCELYDNYLKNWISEPFQYMTREGTFYDNLYTNFVGSDIELLTYDALGDNFIERQAIKRQRKNIVEKFKRLPKHNLDAIILELKKEKII
jgi:site-specific DNA-adenine methylase